MLESAGACVEGGCESAEGEEAYTIVAGRPDLILLCDHASNAVPAEYGMLGLHPAQFERHIGYDIGAETLTLSLARRLGATAVMSRFSRLLIDPNRGLDDPTLIMRLSDGAVVPGNAHVDAAERARRVERFYAPYDAAVGRMIDRAFALTRDPVIFSLHSFTPLWKGAARPWHAGILWDQDARVARPLIEALRADPALVVGDNEPYTGTLPGDTMWRHATMRGLRHALLEIRQDLIADAAGAEGWADRLAPIFADLAGPAHVTEKP